MVDPNLISLVHDTRHMAALNKYLTDRINTFKENLVVAEGNEVIRIQAAIIELKKLLKIKETVLSKRD